MHLRTALFCWALIGSFGVSPIHAQENAPPPSFSYQDLRQNYQSQLDRCDMMNMQEVFSLTSTPIANIIDEKSKWLDLLTKTKEDRLACYTLAQSAIEEAIAAGLVDLQTDEDNTALAARLELDKQAGDLLKIRGRINRQLLESMAADLETTLETYKNTRNKKERPSFVMESSTTTNLIRQDMAIVLELERRGLNLENRLLHNQKDKEKQLIKLKLQTALHYLSRALLTYEDINSIKPARLLASLRSEYLYATGQMHEILAIAPDLSPIPEFIRPNVLQLTNRMQLIELDVEGALRDFSNGVMEQSLEDWLAELYQDLSNLSLEINTILHHLKLGAPITVGVDDTLEIPADIAAYINEDTQNSEKKEVDKHKNKTHNSDSNQQQKMSAE